MIFVRTWWTDLYHVVARTVESHYLQRFVQIDSNYTESVGTGKIISIISKGSHAWGSLSIDLVIHILGLVLSVGVVSFFLIKLNFYLLIILFGLLFIGQIAGIYLNKLNIQARLKRVEFGDQISRNIVKIIMAKIEILQSDRILEETEKIKNLHTEQINCNKQMANSLVPFFGLSYLISFILLFSVFFIFARMYINGEVDLATIASVSAAILMMQKEFTKSLDFLKNFGKEFANIQNMWNFFDNAPMIKGYDSGKDFIYKNGGIYLENISYSYVEGKNVFSDFSLNISGGKMTALVGQSGSGKTTLVKLIAGYIRPNSGKIIIDNQNLSEVSLKSFYMYNCPRLCRESGVKN